LKKRFLGRKIKKNIADSLRNRIRSILEYQIFAQTLELIIWKERRGNCLKSSQKNYENHYNILVIFYKIIFLDDLFKAHFL
jgi:hypothetical protein